MIAPPTYSPTGGFGSGAAADLDGGAAADFDGNGCGDEADANHLSDCPLNGPDITPLSLAGRGPAARPG